MKFLNPIMRQYLRLRMNRIRRIFHSPIEAQENEFKNLISQSRYTDWGKQHDYAAIRTYAEFIQRVAVQDYNSLKPYFQRVLSGQSNVLYPNSVKWFSKSSGTTNDTSKFIPVTRDCIYKNHVKAGKDLMAMYYHQHPTSKVFSGKSLLVGGSLHRNDINPHIQIGDVSAILIHQLPEWLQFYRVPDRSIILMKDWTEKVDAIANSVVHENITTISGVPSWILMILQRVVEISGRSTVAEVWPNLELFVHGGISFLPYKEQFQKIIGKPINYVNAYNASEGFFAFQDKEDDGMLLLTGHGVFYEFIPQEEWSKENPVAVALQDVELNKNYALLISTNAGLWRYKIGDVVIFTSLNPFKIEIAGRTAQYLNTFGEELMVYNTDLAISKTCEECEAIVSEYTVAPKYMTNKEAGSHEWVVEFEQAPFDLDLFTQKLDNHLKNLNSDYASKRQGNILLGAPIINVVPKKTFLHWLEARKKLGGQNKVPRLCESREYLESILS